MSKGISVVLPAINEPLLNWTCENIKRVCPDAEVIVMMDKDHKGVGQMRHQGIMKATSDVVFVADAHMDFAGHCFQRLAAAVRKDPQAIVCAECRGLTEDLKPHQMDRFAADLYEVMPGGTSVNPKVFVSKWVKRQGTSTYTVPIVLGGCYAMSKEWYVEGLGGVWKYHKGWGKSEQMLALMNYYMGGTCKVVPSTYAAHQFRKGRVKENFGFFKRNTMLLLYGFVPESRREELLNTFAPVNRTDTYGIKELLHDGSIDAIQTWVDDNAVRSYSDIRAICKAPPGTTNYTATEQPRACPKCKSLASKVIKTYDPKRRKRRCLNCGHQYVTFSATL